MELAEVALLGGERCLWPGDFLPAGVCSWVKGNFLRYPLRNQVCLHGRNAIFEVSNFDKIITSCKSALYDVNKSGIKFV